MCANGACQTSHSRRIVQDLFFTMIKNGRNCIFKGLQIYLIFDKSKAICFWEVIYIREWEMLHMWLEMMCDVFCAMCDMCNVFCIWLNADRENMESDLASTWLPLSMKTSVLTIFSPFYFCKVMSTGKDKCWLPMSSMSFLKGLNSTKSTIMTMCLQVHEFTGTSLSSCLNI